VLQSRQILIAFGFVSALQLNSVVRFLKEAASDKIYGWRYSKEFKNIKAGGERRVLLQRQRERVSSWGSAKRIRSVQGIYKEVSYFFNTQCTVIAAPP
jgi:hypothetical protein